MRKCGGEGRNSLRLLLLSRAGCRGVGAGTGLLLGNRCRVRFGGGRIGRSALLGFGVRPLIGLGRRAEGAGTIIRRAGTGRLVRLQVVRAKRRLGARLRVGMERHWTSGRESTLNGNYHESSDSKRTK